MVECVFDIECYSNLFMITLKELNKDRWFTYALFNDKEVGISKTDLTNLIRDNKLIGYFSKSYDNNILDYFLSNSPTNLELKSVNDSIDIGRAAGTKGWQSFRSQFKGKFINPQYHQIYKSFDLQFYYKDGLKAYQHVRGYKNIEETPISFNDVVSDDMYSGVLHYNKADILATECMYNEFLPLQKSILNFKSTYGITANIDDQSLNIVDEFVKATVKPPTIDKELEISLDHPEIRRLAGMIKNDMVRNHLLDLLNLPGKILPYNKYKKNEDGQDILEQYDAYIETANPKFSITIKNATLGFEVGGLHSQMLPIALESDSETTIIDADFNSLYPYIIMALEMVPFYYGESKKLFLQKYSELIDIRFKLKEADDPLQESYKLLLNMITGKYKSKGSSVFDPSIHTKICMMAQYLIYYVLEQIEPYIERIGQVNTDGLTFEVKRTNEAKVREIMLSISNEFKLNWKFINYKSFYAKDVSNYIAFKEDGSEKYKGGDFNLETVSTPKIIKKVCIEHFKTGRDIQNIIYESKDIYDFLYFSKVEKNGEITVEKDGVSIPHTLGKYLRFYHCKTDGVIVKNNGNQISNAFNCKIQNEITDDTSNVDYDWYINKISELIYNIKTSKIFNHDEVISKFKKLGLESELTGKTKVKDDKEPFGYKFKRESSVYGPYLNNYPTLAVSCRDKLLVVDIDTLDSESSKMIEMCLASGTMYSQSDVKKDSYRFIFKNTGLVGHWVRENKSEDKTKTVEFEVFGKYKIGVSISGYKYELNDVIIENYVLFGDEIKELPEDIEMFITSACVQMSKTKDVQEHYLQEVDHNTDMKKLFDLANDPNFKIRTINGKTSIQLKKRPKWLVMDGNFTSTTVTIFQKTNLTKFDIYIHTHKPGFPVETLRERLEPYIYKINKEKGITTVSNNFFEEQKDVRSGLPEISSELYSRMPVIFQDLTKDFEGKKKDVVFLSLLPCVSFFFSNVKSNYYYSKMYNNIYIFIVAKTGMGKSIMKRGKSVMTPLKQSLRQKYKSEKILYDLLPDADKKKSPKPIQNHYLVSGDTNQPALLKILDENEGKLVLFDTEADNLATSQKNGYENYSDIIRKGVMNESILKTRAGSDAIDIDIMKLNILISGTPDQIKKVIGKDGSENGTLNRFIPYLWMGDVVIEDPHGMISDFDAPFEAYGQKLLDFYNQYFSKEDYYTFDLSTEQKRKFFQRLSVTHEDEMNWEDNSVDGIVKRNFLFAKKIMITFACLRLMENNKPFGSSITITESDFDCVLELIDVFIKHGVVLNRGFEVEEPELLKAWKVELYKILPQQFTRIDLITEGKKLMKSERSLDSLLSRWKKDGTIDKNGHAFTKIKNI